MENQAPYMETEWEPRNQGSDAIKPGGTAKWETPGRGYGTL